MYLPPEFLLCASPAVWFTLLPESYPEFLRVSIWKALLAWVRNCATSKPWEGIVETSSTEFNDVCKPKLGFILTCSKELVTALSSSLAK